MKNELQMLLICCDRALSKLIEENPKSGIVADKGKIEEARMTYKEAQKSLRKLGTYFGLKGTNTFGICLNCAHWNTANFATKQTCGVCKIGSTKKDYHPDILHAYDSCNRHLGDGGYGV